MIHDPLCPFFYDQTGRELVRQTGNPCTYCDLIASVREDERRKVDLQHERETNDLLRKILTKRDEILSEFWQRESDENRRRIAELENKRFNLRHK